MHRPWVLGISCSHNGSACLLHGDEGVAAIQDERLLRFKRQATHARWVSHCIAYCLEAGGIDARQLDLIVWSEVRGETPTPDGDVRLNDLLRADYYSVPTLSVPHHYAHAVSVFATSGFPDAAVLVVDGAGTLVRALPDAERAVVWGEAEADDVEWLTGYHAEGTSLRPLFKQAGTGHTAGGIVTRFASLGNMYSAVGQRIFGQLGEYLDGPGKVMGLAPYGTPTIDVEAWLTTDARTGVVRFHPEVLQRPEAQCVWPRDFQACANLAASVQRATEQVLLTAVSQLRERSGSRRMCYAGGVALNSVANERIVRAGQFDDFFFFPAAEDSGVAVGAAYHGLWQLTGEPTRRRLRHDALGRAYGAHEVDAAIAAAPAVITRRASSAPDTVARMLRDGQIVGWFSGRSELGPRSLGQRAILCDPRRADGKDVLNARVKHRESFRPFAPIVLREHARDWFDVPDGQDESPFMLRVWPFRGEQGARVPAVTHVDGTARVQTLAREANPRLYEVIEAFHALTGVPIVLNTSFNVAGEPIVETPEDALWCLLATGLDHCVFDDCVVSKTSGFTSVLDLYPRLRAATITLDMPVNDGVATRVEDGLQAIPALGRLQAFSVDQVRALRQQMQASRDVTRPVAHATVRTRWGDAAVLLSDEQWQLLTLIDGDSDGHTLLARGPRQDADWLMRTLAALRRASVLAFAAEARMTRVQQNGASAAISLRSS